MGRGELKRVRDRMFGLHAGTSQSCPEREWLKMGDVEKSRNVFVQKCPALYCARGRHAQDWVKPPPSVRAKERSAPLRQTSAGEGVSRGEETDGAPGESQGIHPWNKSDLR